MRKIEKNRLLLSGKSIALSENETKNYLELTNRVCYFNYPNANSIALPYDGSTLEKAKTLIDMPIQGKYTVNAEGEPTFKGHERYIDEKGEIYFDIECIGVHTDVYIADDFVETADGSTQELPCLFAKQKVWTLNKNAVRAVKRLYSEGRLYNSWVVSVAAYEYKDGIKTLTDYIFEANTFLGYEFAEPAFGKSAKVLSLSGNRKDELLIANAFAEDIINIRTGGKKLSHNKKMETSALTMFDLHDLVRTTCRKVIDGYITYLFPEKKTVWYHPYEAKENEFIIFTYQVHDDDTVTVTQGDTIELSCSLPEVNKVIADRDKTILETSDSVKRLQEEVQKLEQYKLDYEKIAAEKEEAEKQEKVSKLKDYVVRSGVFTHREIESSEISGLIDALDDAKIKAMIADRIVVKSKEKHVETSGIKTESGRIELTPGKYTGSGADEVRSFIFE